MDHLQIPDTVITNIKERHQSVWFYIALAPRDVHCVKCVAAVFPSIKRHFVLNLVITDALPISRRACRQNNPAVRVSGTVLTE